MTESLDRGALMASLKARAATVGLSLRQVSDDGLAGEKEAIVVKWPLGQKKAVYAMSCRLDEADHAARFREVVKERSWGLLPPTLTIETTTIKGGERSGSRSERAPGAGGGRVDFGAVREAIKAAVSAAGWRFELEVGRAP